MPLRVRLVLIAALVLLTAAPAAADVNAHDVAAIHTRHGHEQYRQGQGDRGHRWSDYQRQARQLNRYARAVAAHQLRRCGMEPHCAVRLASFLTRAPYGLVDRVIWCESRYDPNAANPSSSAGGLGQWLESSWASHAPQWGMAGRSRFEVWPAALVTSGVIAQGGIHNWDASRHCWG